MTCHIEIGETLPDGRVEMIMYHLYDKCHVCGPNYDPDRVAKKVATFLFGVECKDGERPIRHGLRYVRV